MARIPKEEIDRLRREVSVEKLVEAHGVKLVRDHDKRIGRCPFHQEEKHALTVIPKANTWTCGVCGGGSCIEWVMKANGVSFRHAAELLLKDYPGMISGTGAAATTAPTTKSTITKLPTLFDRDATDDDLLVRVVHFYHSTLKESPEGLGYLAARGLNSAEMISRFTIGFSNRTLAYRIPEKHRREGEVVRGRLQKLGILRESGHEHFNGSVTFPIFDADNTRVIGMYGRKVTARLRDGTPLHLHVPDPPRGVWNALGLTGGEVVISSSVIDALTFWCAGVRNVTAAYGVDGFTNDHREAFKRYAVKKVYIAFRRDRAGDRGAEKIGAELNTMGIETGRILFAKEMDANDYALAGKSLEEAVRNAEWSGKGNTSVTVPDEIPAVAADDDRGERDRDPALSLGRSVVSASNGNEMVFTFGDRRWRVRGLERNTSHGDLRVNVLVSREGSGFHIDTVDLYVARWARCSSNSKPA